MPTKADRILKNRHAGQPIFNSLSNTFNDLFASQALADEQKAGAGGGEAGENSTVVKLRRMVGLRGARGIIGLGRSFRIADRDHSGSITLDEFHSAMRNYGMKLTPSELKVLMVYFDKDGDGTIDYNEFLVGMRGHMPPRRRTLITEGGLNTRTRARARARGGGCAARARGGRARGQGEWDEVGGRGGMLEWSGGQKRQRKGSVTC